MQSKNHFTSRFSFLMVTAGAAVGLGNIWAFPFIAGQNGGGGFVLIYTLALLMVAIPAMIAELVIGRLGQASPSVSLNKVKADNGGKGPWSLMGWVGMGANILVLSFYAVIAGQAAYYAYFAVTHGFETMPSVAIRAIDNGFKTSFHQPVFWTALFIGMTMLIVSLRVTSGLEKTGRYLMPALFILLVVLVAYAAYYGDFDRAYDFLLGFDRFQLSSGVVIAAIGQAFFTLSVGLCGLMMYGAYMGEDIKLPGAVASIATMDFLVAVLAGFAIFPLVFAENMNPGAGPGLVFMTLPVLFAKLPFGDWGAFVFFVLLTMAAITSSIAMMAPMVGRFEDSGISRVRASIILGAVTFILSFMTTLSFGPLYDFYPLDMFSVTEEMNMFALIREGVNHVILPLGGLAFLLIAGWGIRRHNLLAALNVSDGAFFNQIRFLIRYIAPLALIVMIFMGWFYG